MKIGKEDVTPALHRVIVWDAHHLGGLADIHAQIKCHSRSHEDL